VSLLLLAWRSIAHRPLQSVLLAACVGLTFLVPIGVERLVDLYGTALRARAAATPLVVGAPESRFDLVLGALYFRASPARRTSMAELERLVDGGLGVPVPLVLGARARGRPVVGTTPDYFERRALTCAAGRLPLWLGEAVLGAEAARALGLAPGDTLLSERGSLYDLAVGYPLEMQVTGVLAPSGTADDGAVFVDVKTAWIQEGILHGHVDADLADEASVLARGTDEVVLGAAVFETMRIGPDERDAFHVHGAAEDLPLSAVLVFPRSAKEATLLKGRYGVRDDALLVEPSAVVEELSGFVFKLKAFFDANVLLVSAATVLLVTLVVLLMLRVRAGELETLARIGCSRTRAAGIFALELGLVLGAGLAAAAGLGLVLAGALARGYLGGA
jgi:putative ABC transport system permease protein